jgi:hypothetical protein
MAPFKLTPSVEINCEINVNVLRKCKAELNIDLAGIFENGLLERLHSDPVTLCDVLFVCCESSLTAKKIDDKAFGELLASGDVIAAATDAFMETLVTFTPPGSRPAIQKTIQKIRDIQTKQTKLALERLDSPLLDQMVERQHNQIMDQFERQTTSLPHESGTQSTN